MAERRVLTWAEIKRELDKAKSEGKQEWKRLAELIREAERKGWEVETPQVFSAPPRRRSLERGGQG